MKNSSRLRRAGLLRRRGGFLGAAGGPSPGDVAGTRPGEDDDGGAAGVRFGERRPGETGVTEFVFFFSRLGGFSTHPALRITFDMAM